MLRMLRHSVPNVAFRPIDGNNATTRHVISLIPGHRFIFPGDFLAR
jgi:hypothetical protein